MAWERGTAAQTAHSGAKENVLVREPESTDAKTAGCTQVQKKLVNAKASVREVRRSRTLPPLPHPSPASPQPKRNPRCVSFYQYIKPHPAQSIVWIFYSSRSCTRGKDSSRGSKRREKKTLNTSLPDSTSHPPSPRLRPACAELKLRFGVGRRAGSKHSPAKS